MDNRQSSIKKAGLSLGLGWGKNETSFLIKNEIWFKGIYQLEAFYNLDLNYSYHLNKINVHVYIQIPTNLFGHKTAVNFIVSMCNKIMFNIGMILSTKIQVKWIKVCMTEALQKSYGIINSQY